MKIINPKTKPCDQLGYLSSFSKIKKKKIIKKMKKIVSIPELAAHIKCHSRASIVPTHGKDVAFDWKESNINWITIQHKAKMNPEIK